MKIFIINEHPFFCQMSKKSLEREGIEVFTLNDASDCIYVIEDVMPNALLLDAQTIAPFMPAFLEKLKAGPASSIRRVWLVEKESEALGEEFLLKPIAPGELVQKFHETF